jgi:Rod binding domain-containing protein
VRNDRHTSTLVNICCAKTFAKTGGIGIASHVYDQLLKQQGVKA